MGPRWANGNPRPWKEAVVRKGNKEHLHRATGKEKTCLLKKPLCVLWNVNDRGFHDLLREKPFILLHFWD
jgi:hypothetical protein